MQIKHEVAHPRFAADKGIAMDAKKPEKSAGQNAKPGTSATLSRVAKAVAMGMLASSKGALARQTPSDVALALPQPGRSVARAGALYASRHLTQIVDCGCALAVGTGGDTTAVAAATGYTAIALAAHKQTNNIVIPQAGATVDVNGFLPGDGLTISYSGLLNYTAQSYLGGTTVTLVPTGTLAEETTPGRTYVNLHDYTFAQYQANQPVYFDTAVQITPCSTQLAGWSDVPGGTLTCAAPPPAPVSPLPTPVVMPTLPMSPTPPSPMVPAEAPVAPPSPALPPPPMSPAPAPAHSGLGSGAAIGYIAAAVAGIGAAATGAILLLKRRRAHAQHGSNVELGTRHPAPTLPDGPIPA